MSVVGTEATALSPAVLQCLMFYSAEATTYSQQECILKYHAIEETYEDKQLSVLVLK